MAANRYDQAAEMPILNTYVPIDFNQLYRIGATQKAAVDQAIRDVSAAVQTFGEFRSPSRVDTENYYNMTIGKMQDLLDEVQYNPDSIKDASFRSKLYGRINSLDYAGLSLLRESANNLRQGLAMRAEMEAKGLYNEAWDDSNIDQYDTLGRGAVFTDITPVAYMNANQLSNPYFDNLAKGTIGTTWKDGAKYVITGNTIDDLRAVADARYSDIVNTPQGQKYYQQFLRQNNGNAEAATKAFKDMIVASQIDRTLRPTLTVDPAWLASLRASSRNGGNNNVQTVAPTRLDLINQGINTKLALVSMNNMNKYYTPEQQEQLSQEIAALNQQYQIAESNFNANPTDDNLILREQARNAYNQARFGIEQDVIRRTMLDEFQNKAHSDAKKGEQDSQYSRETYRFGVQAALDKVSTDLSLNAEDRLFTQSGGVYSVKQDNMGNSRSTYDYTNSSGFLLPETVFSAMTGAQPREGGREKLSFTGNTDLNFRTLFESGGLNSVSFNPDNKVIRVANGQMAVPGTVSIPVDEIENKVGTGTLAYDFLPGIFGSETTERALKQLYGAQKVTRKIGDDDVEYFQFKAYRMLAPENGTSPESITAIDQTWMNTNSYGGIGSASLAGDNYYNSSSRALNLQ